MFEIFDPLREFLSPHTQLSAAAGRHWFAGGSCSNWCGSGLPSLIVLLKSGMGNKHRNRGDWRDERKVSSDRYSILYFVECLFDLGRCRKAHC